ncbi:hypothetical protein GCM10027174_43690 [Salinifilum aidingensis]
MESRPVSSANLDPNLLVALEHLLRERSVTGAAERMRLSQPALSATSARPRRHFDDELLARDRTPRSWWRVFLADPAFPAGTDRVALVQARLAPLLTKTGAVRGAPPERGDAAGRGHVVAPGARERPRARVAAFRLRRSRAADRHRWGIAAGGALIAFPGGDEHLCHPDAEPQVLALRPTCSVGRSKSDSRTT